MTSLENAILAIRRERLAAEVDRMERRLRWMQAGLELLLEARERLGSDPVAQRIDGWQAASEKPKRSVP